MVASVLMALSMRLATEPLASSKKLTYVVEDEQNFSLSSSRGGQCALCKTGEGWDGSAASKVWGSLASKQRGGRAVQRPSSRAGKYHFESMNKRAESR